MLNETSHDLAIELAQKATCVRYGALYVPAWASVNSGFAIQTEGKTPINALRHPVTIDTTGWYLWCGESYSSESDFFKPVHTRHLYEKYQEIGHLLGLPPGYRFLVAGDYLDVWFDPSLLAV